MNPSTITFSNTFPKNKEDIILGIDMNINSNINCIIICILDVPIDKKQIKRNVMKLSGGQQQRVAIARALVSDAPIILADEPTGNLDSVTAGEIINILKTLAKDRNKCVIVVTHSKEVADSADIILELSGKKLKKVNKMNLEVE